MKLEFNFDQSGVVPYRNKNGNLEVLLITSKKKKKWIIPKGYVEFNLTAFESAKKEAYEEAGILGTNETYELGSFADHKPIGTRHIQVFSMEVVKILDDYPEKQIRERKWFTLEDATKNISMPDVAAMMFKLKSMLKDLILVIITIDQQFFNCKFTFFIIISPGSEKSE